MSQYYEPKRCQLCNKDYDGSRLAVCPNCFPTNEREIMSKENDQDCTNCIYCSLSGGASPCNKCKHWGNGNVSYWRPLSPIPPATPQASGKTCDNCGCFLTCINTNRGTCLDWQPIPLAAPQPDKERKDYPWLKEGEELRPPTKQETDDLKIKDLTQQLTTCQKELAEAKALNATLQNELNKSYKEIERLKEQLKIAKGQVFGGLENDYKEPKTSE